jgi:hypothetical protein
MNQLHDAIISVLPHGARPAPYSESTKYGFNCPLCAIRGHTPDKGKRGAFFLKHDGSATYSCFQCAFRAGQSPYRSLTKGMDYVLEHMGLGQDSRTKLGYDLWAAGVALRTGTMLKPDFVPEGPPAGAKPIGDWIADNIADPNFNDVLLDLAEMTPALRDGYYWTPDPGPSGDMNRRFTWVFLDAASKPIGWGAHPLSTNPNSDVIFSDPDVMFQ